MINPTPSRPTSIFVAFWAASCLLCFSGGAHAQAGSFFGGAGGPYLDKADLVQADAAASKLLDPQPAAQGTVISWREPQSGDSGTLTMGRSFRKDGNDCRSVSWHEAFKAGTERTYSLDTCRISGTWKLM